MPESYQNYSDNARGDDAIPPHDADGERAVLGSVLCDSGAAKVAFGTLAAGDFYSPVNQATFAALADLMQRDGAIDHVTVRAELQRLGHVERFKLSPDFPLCLVEETPGAANIEGQVRIVKDAAYARAAWGAAQRLSRAVNAGMRGADLEAELKRLSALADTSQEQRRRMSWLSIGELRLACEEDVAWLWGGYLARQAVTLLVAEPKGGKSTLAFGLIKNLLTGAQFLGRPTQRTGAVYLSEEPLATLREKADFFGFAEDSRVRLVSSRMPPRVSFAQALQEAADMALEIQAGLIVVDTLGDWAGWKKDEENDAGTCEAAMRIFKGAAARADVALLVNHHTRKNDSEVRGSTALKGAADIVLTLTKDKEASRRRLLEAEGRFAEMPEPMRLDLTDSGYVTVDTPRGAGERFAGALKVLPLASPGMTRETWAQAAGLTEWRVRRAQKELSAEGWLVQSGTGKNKDPLRWHRRPAPQPCEPPAPLGGHRVTGLGQTQAEPSLNPVNQTHKVDPTSQGWTSTKNTSEDMRVLAALGAAGGAA